MACPTGGPDKIAVQGAIQLVNAALKVKMGRMNAAVRLIEMAETLLSEAKAQNASLMLPETDLNHLRAQAKLL